jgi:hypothetical protein
MATKKDKTEKATLKKGIPLSSQEADEEAKRIAAEEEVELAADVDPNNCRRVYIEDISPNPSRDIYAGQVLQLRASVIDDEPDEYNFNWTIDGGEFVKGVNNPERENPQGKQIVYIATRKIKANKLKVTLRGRAVDYTQEGRYVCQVDYTVRQPDLADLKNNLDEKLDEINETIKTRPNFNNTVPVSLQRTTIQRTDDLGLWVVIRRSTQAIGFNNYLRFMDLVLCGIDSQNLTDEEFNSIDTRYSNLRKVRALPFNDTDAYRLLKVATEAFLLINGGVKVENFQFGEPDIIDLNSRMGGSGTLLELDDSWDRYLASINGTANPMLPYLALVSRKFGNETLKNQVFLNQPTLADDFAGNTENCLSLLGTKLIQPFLVELIWSYWHEEGMLVQTMSAIARRFQNVRGPNGGRDPLANLEIDPLRGLNNLLWGFVQDEQHRLSLVRRVYEYDHHYGIALQGKAVPKLRPADSRSKFIEAFHHLLHLCSVFFKQDDDTTINSDGFPILNALREVHLILSQGAHNQFGDLPSTARQEMLIQQWLLARPEFREFLPTRNMVAYPEPWMDRVDAMKSLQGWTDISIDHFNRLAVFGEQILLSIRFGAWSDIIQSAPSAANWARFWRAEIQGYIHDYRAVTGVDLSSSARIDSTPPSVHLFRRYMEQARR